MSKRTYIPDRGDLIEMNFQPAAGREIDKRRPAIVLSPVAYNRRSGLCLAVPMSTDLTLGLLSQVCLNSRLFTQHVRLRMRLTQCTKIFS